MNQFFTSAAPLSAAPTEITNKIAIKKDIHRHEKAARREVMPGFPRTAPFNSIASIREYLSGDRITCLLCGRAFKALCGHIARIHNMPVDEYKERYGLPYRAGLSSEPTQELNRANGKRPQQVERVKKLIRSQHVLDALKAKQGQQRTSTLHKLQSIENASKAKKQEKHFNKEHANKVLAYMVEKDVSLSAALRQTGIMKATAFRNLCARFPGEIDLAGAHAKRTRGVCAPMSKNPLVKEEIARLRAEGLGFKQIGEILGIHEEYASFINRGKPKARGLK